VITTEGTFLDAINPFESKTCYSLKSEDYSQTTLIFTKKVRINPEC
jgi:hypothetical protein